VERRDLRSRRCLRSRGLRGLRRAGGCDSRRDHRAHRCGHCYRYRHPHRHGRMRSGRRSRRAGWRRRVGYRNLGRWRRYGGGWHNRCRSLRQGRANHENQRLHRRIAWWDLERDLPVRRQRYGHLQADFAGLGADFHIAVTGLLDHRSGYDNGPEKLFELVRQLLERCLPGGFRGCRRHNRRRAGAGSGRSCGSGRRRGRYRAGHGAPVIADRTASPQGCARRMRHRNWASASEAGSDCVSRRAPSGRAG
jgi:hypothetical protein